VTTLVRDGLELRYEVLGGSGPALLLPHLNFSWPDYLDLGPFTERYTVITASPRGFAKSSRLEQLHQEAAVRQAEIQARDGFPGGGAGF
jgi:pimeloyl-ACP methyl ester carboxylesterase